MRARWHTIVFFGRIGIPYKCPAFAARDSLDAKPVTGSLHFATSRCRLADFIAEGLVLCVLCEFLLAIVCRVFLILLWHCSDTEMATDDRYRSPGTLWRLMLIWIRMESTSFRQFRTSWVCIPGSRERLLSGCCLEGMITVFAR